MQFEIPLSKFKGPFNLSRTIASEQCPSDFWTKGEKYVTFAEVDNDWIRIEVVPNRDSLLVEATKPKAVKNLLLYQFWAEYDLDEFYNEFSDDKYISKAINACEGLRVMRDLNPEQMFLRALLTQNSSVRQIRKMQDLIMKHYGEKVNGFYSFPKPKTLAKIDKTELEEKCKVGYRAEYILNAARLLANGELNLNELRKLETSEARRILTKINGIGPKVADIILLYALGKPDTFPMDVWLRRALIREYFDGKKVSDQKLREFTLSYFGNHAGFAHLYMWSFERKLNKMIPIKSLR